MNLLLVCLLLSPGQFAEDVKIRRDIPYAMPKNERHTLDVYAPGKGEKMPVIFWIHGGGWQVGDKTQVEAKPQYFVGQGFVFVSTNYRFVPHVTIHEMTGDIAKSLHWIHDHIAEVGGDPSNVIIAGHSAGAQLAALLATDEQYLKAEGLSLSMLVGCIPVDGDTYDVPKQIATVEQRRKDIYGMKFGDEEHQKALSPITHVAKRKGIPPFLFLHVADHPETELQAERMAAKLKEAGISATTHGAPGKTHNSINDELGQPNDKPTAAVREFITEALKQSAVE